MRDKARIALTHCKFVSKFLHHHISRRTKAHITGFLIFVVAMLILSASLSSQQSVGGITTSGWMAHVLAYLIMTFLFIIYFKENHAHLDQGYLLKAIYLSGGYGIFIEILQTQVGHRAFEMLDIASNFVGAFLAVIVFLILRKIFN